MSHSQEYLKEIKNLECVIKQLKRKVERLRKQIRQRPDVTLCKKSEMPKPKLYVCPNCGKEDGIKKAYIMGREIISCSICEWRETSFKGVVNE